MPPPGASHFDNDKGIPLLLWTLKQGLHMPGKLRHIYKVHASFVGDPT